MEVKFDAILGALREKDSNIDPAANARITHLEDTYKLCLYYESIISGTTGTVVPPTGGTIVLDGFAGKADAIICESENSFPNYQAVFNSSGTIIASTMDASGNYVLTGTPSAYPVCILYFYKVKEIDFDYTKTLQEAVTIGDESQFISIANSTGLIDGGVLSVGAPTTTFSITDGRGQVVDNTTGTPTITPVTWTGKTNITATYVASGLVSYVAIDSTGAVIQSLTPFTNTQRRDYIVLGSLIHINLTSLDAVNQFGEIAISPANQLSDLQEAIGLFNISGNVFSANGANLLLNKSTGYLHSQGSNWGVNKKDPNRVLLNSLTGLTFQYRFQTGTNGATGTSINPDIYDLAGVSTAVPSNKFTIQRIFSFVSNNVKIQPGQTLYNSLAEAKGAIQTESFVTESSIAQNGSLRGYLIVQQGTTNLTTTSKAFFLQAPKFGGSAGVGGLSVSTMQDTYNNSVDPEILTDATRGAVSIKRGSASNTDKVLEVLNGAGTTTFSVDGNGLITGTVATAAPATSDTTPASTAFVQQEVSESITAQSKLFNYYQFI